MPSLPGVWRGAQGVLASARPARVRELSALDAAVRRPLPLSTRVGVIGVAGGTGCSTTAGLVAALLAHRRGTRVLAVNASGRARSLLWHTGLTDGATSTPAQDAARSAADDVRTAVDGLPRSAGGVHGLDLHDAADGADHRADHRAAARTPAPGDDRWWDAVAPAGRFFDFVVTDWGVRDVASLGHVVASSTLLCVVTTPDREGLQRAVDLAAAGEGAGTPAVVAVMPARGRGAPGTRTAVRRLPSRAVVFPLDHAHGAARPAPAALLRTGTRLAVLRLGALLVDEGAARRGRELLAPGAGAPPPTASDRAAPAAAPTSAGVPA